MKEETYEITADSLQAARDQAKAKLPEGFRLLSEQILSDGEPVTITEAADESETAFAAARAKVPAGAQVVAETEVQAPESVTLRLSAESEASARHQAERQIDSTSVLQTVSLAVPGKKGFLGIGSSPDQYDFRVLKKAVVNVTHKMDAKIVATAGDEIAHRLRRRVDEITGRLAEIGRELASERDRIARAMRSSNDADLANIMIASVKETLGLANPTGTRGMGHVTELEAEQVKLQGELDKLRDDPQAVEALLTAAEVPSPATGTPAYCDICNATVASSALTVVPLWDLQQAIRDGFNPYQTPGMDMSKSLALGRSFGRGPVEQFGDWRTAVMKDTTDWKFCPDCIAGFRRR